MCEWQRNKHCKEAWIKKMLCSKYFCEKLFMNGPLLSILKASEMSSLLLHLAKTCRCFIIPSVNHFLICDWCSTWQSTVKDPGRVLLDPTSWSLHPAITTAEIQLFPVHQNWMGVGTCLDFLCSTWGRGLSSSQWLLIISRVCYCPSPRHGDTVWGTIWTWVCTATSSFPLCSQLP